jgi:quaternary ammonium compound-resistance protein SugE
MHKKIFVVMHNTLRLTIKCKHVIPSRARNSAPSVKILETDKFSTFNIQHSTFFKTMAWLYVLLAGIFEIGFTTCMKMEAKTGETKWSVFFLVCAAISFGALQKAMETIPLGTAYAIWTGIGAVGTVAVGIIFFNESVGLWRVFFIATLVGSIIGLKLATPN